jgi:hypothetical protein
MVETTKLALPPTLKELVHAADGHVLTDAELVHKLKDRGWHAKDPFASVRSSLRRLVHNNEIGMELLNVYGEKGYFDEGCRVEKERQREEHWAERREWERKHQEELENERPVLVAARREILSNADGALTIHEIRKQLPQGVRASIPQLKGVLKSDHLKVRTSLKRFNMRGRLECRTLYELESASHG